MSGTRGQVAPDCGLRPGVAAEVNRPSVPEEEEDEDEDEEEEEEQGNHAPEAAGAGSTSAEAARLIRREQR